MTKTILLAEDSESVRSILKMTLQFKGYHILQAEDGQQAYEILQNTGCDLLIADIQMPNMTGLELLRKVRHEMKNEKLPVIICTAESTPTQAEILSMGANKVIIKPFSPIDILSIVEGFIS